jgi:hypothetical protein
MVKIDQSFMQRAARRDVEQRAEQSQATRSQSGLQSPVVKGVEQDDFQPGVKQGFTVFYRKIMAAMEKSLQRPYEPVEQELNEAQLEGAEKRANQAASNILGFIEKQFQVDKAAGRSQEQLNSRYEAALKGFEQGYKEAEDILGSLSLLSPELEEEITQTKDLVLEGLAELKRTLIEGTETDSSEATEKTGASRWVGGIEQAQANEFSFELTTNDGDKVTIYASAASLNRVEGGYQQTGGGNGSGNASSNLGYLESISINQQQF